MPRLRQILLPLSACVERDEAGMGTELVKSRKNFFFGIAKIPLRWHLVVLARVPSGLRWETTT
jgi:hypothetical protein